MVAVELVLLAHLPEDPVQPVLAVVAVRQVEAERQADSLLTLCHLFRPKTIYDSSPLVVAKAVAPAHSVLGDRLQAFQMAADLLRESVALAAADRVQAHLRPAVAQLVLLRLQELARESRLLDGSTTRSPRSMRSSSTDSVELCRLKPSDCEIQWSKPEAA